MESTGQTTGLPQAVAAEAERVKATQDFAAASQGSLPGKDTPLINLNPVPASSPIGLEGETVLSEPNIENNIFDIFSDQYDASDPEPAA